MIYCTQTIPRQIELWNFGPAQHNVKDRASLFDYTQPIDAKNVTLRYFRPALEALDLPAARWHDLRHSFAVMSLSAGEHFMQVSKMLGHSTFVLTLNTYGDYITTAEGGKAAPLARPQAQKPDNKVVPIDRASG